MIDAKQLIKNSYFKSKDHSDKALALKRVRTTIAKLKINSFDSLELDLKEQKCISDALVLLDKAVEVHTKAAKLTKDIETRKADRYAAALALVMKSDFGKLESIKDKVALLFSEKSHMLRDIEKASDVNYIMKFTFQDCLESISHSLAYQQGDMQEELGKALAKFQAILPDTYAKTTHLVERMQKLLAAG
ncbi:hypothetical protein [Comamonas sp.]|uniref:hypothetical protein n=1 Tax=Comamonas sp. TaxID=34028 RepID=UPI00258B1878|nr:hypothetical protein [Comamonas sp.]